MRCIKRDDYITENFPSRDIPYVASIFDDLKGGGVGKFFIQKLMFYGIRYDYLLAFIKLYTGKVYVL